MSRLQMRHRLARGFTLVETIIVMVTLGIAAIAIISLEGNIFNGQVTNRDIVVGTQLMQECAESLLARGRVSYGDSCFASSTAATACCNTMTVSGYSAPGVTVTTGNSATANMAACPYSSGADCTLVSVTQGGLRPVVLMLIRN